MRRQIGIKLIAAGTIIGANVSAFPLAHAHAEEIDITENSAEIQKVSIDEFQLDQAFSPEVKAYTASVGNEIKTMSLLVEKKETAATIKVNGEDIVSGAKTSLPLSTGKNEFVFTVTNGTEVSTYTITVDRAKNDNNHLSNLSLSTGEISFDPEKTDYQMEVKNEISKLTFKANAEVNSSTVTINGSTVKSGEDHEVKLPVGSTTFTIIVTAENGSKKIYSVTVVREAKQTSSSSNGKVEEKVQTEKDMPASETSLNSGDSEITPTTESNIRGTKSAATVDVMAVSSGTNSKSNESFGASSTTNTSETKTTANLGSLSVSNGTWNKTFSSDSYTYHITLANDIKNLTISAESEHTDAEIYIEENALSDNREVVIGDQAKTAISVIVENGEERKTYVLIFEKDIEDEAVANAEDTSISTGKETTTVSSTSTTEADGHESMKESTVTNQINSRTEKQTETPSFWQKLRSFFGL